MVYEYRVKYDFRLQGSQSTRLQVLVVVGNWAFLNAMFHWECKSLPQGYENNSREVAPIGQTLPDTETLLFPAGIV